MLPKQICLNPALKMFNVVKDLLCNRVLEDGYCLQEETLLLHDLVNARYSLTSIVL